MRILRKICHFRTTFKRRMSSESTHIAGMRKPYKGEQEIFDTEHLAALEPIGQFKNWFDVACKTDGIMEANAMSLATATREGIPSVRMVLLKGYDKSGFTFYTNFESRKGKELANNPHACLMFYWEILLRSVRIEGKVQRLSEEESREYFDSRPRSSQIGAIVSKQSTPIPGREGLNERNAELIEKYADESVPIPKPDYWGGYKVVPHTVEFWQGQTNRLHDRIVFHRPQQGEQLDPSIAQHAEQGSDGWVYYRLSP